MKEEDESSNFIINKMMQHILFQFKNNDCYSKIFLLEYFQRSSDFVLKIIKINNSIDIKVLDNLFKSILLRNAKLKKQKNNFGFFMFLRLDMFANNKV